VTFNSIISSAAERDAWVSIINLKVSGCQLTSFVRAHRSKVVLYMMDKTWSNMLFESLCSLILQFYRFNFMALTTQYKLQSFLPVISL
jgi:hypothetical protein